MKWNKRVIGVPAFLASLSEQWCKNEHNGFQVLHSPSPPPTASPLLLLWPSQCLLLCHYYSSSFLQLLFLFALLAQNSPWWLNRVESPLSTHGHYRVVLLIQLYLGRGLLCPWLSSLPLSPESNRWSKAPPMLKDKRCCHG